MILLGLIILTCLILVVKSLAFTTRDDEGWEGFWITLSQRNYFLFSVKASSNAMIILSEVNVYFLLEMCY